MPLLFARVNPVPVILIILTLAPSHLFLFFLQGSIKRKQLSILPRDEEGGREGREKEGRSEKSRKVGGRQTEKGREGDRKREREIQCFYPRKIECYPTGNTGILPKHGIYKAQFLQISNYYKYRSACKSNKCFPPTSHCCSLSFNLLYVTANEASANVCLFS